MVGDIDRMDWFPGMVTSVGKQHNTVQKPREFSEVQMRKL